MKRSSVKNKKRDALTLRILPFILSASLYSCSVYDSSLADSPFESGLDDASGNANGGSNNSTVVDTGIVDVKQSKINVDSAIDDSGEDDAQECVRNPDDDGSCPEICSEVCDGADNDCDGETDEDDANAFCALQNAVSQCVEGECVFVNCTQAYGDCDGDANNYCETQLGTPTNCSGCGDNCEDLPNVTTASCVSGVCDITSCSGAYRDCDGTPGNGCEKNLATDVNNCNSCGNACPDLPFASEACVDGACVIADCDETHRDCDGDPSNGCEDDNDWPCFHYVPSNFDPAILNPSSAPSVTLDCDAVYDSSNPADFSSWCGQPEPLLEMDTAPEPDVAILTFLNFTISSTGSLTIVGDKPVIFAVFGNATIDGDVDADATFSTPGPGGNIACGSGTGGDGQNSDSDNDGAGGGGGGAFGDNGGAGGPGQHCDSGSKGTAVGNPEVVPLRGGCAGGRGGRGIGSSGRYGGGGGGAVQISAAGTLFISAVVSAAGGGGLIGDGREDGGGGGGSGGGILLEGESVDIVPGAWVTANGGGGAEGASEDSGSAGSDGQDGYRASDVSASGGSTCSKCGDGGDGGSLTHTTGDSGIVGADSGDNGGGGGGGGGVGRIRVKGNQACSLAGTFSPPASTDCLDSN